MSKPQWVLRDKYWMSPTPSLPGVWRLRDGGFFVRARPVNQRGEQVPIKRILRPPRFETPEAAYNWLQAEIDRVKVGAAMSRLMSFSDFALSALERKITDGEIKSAKGREHWLDILEHQLIPEFGPIPIIQLSRDHTRAWKDRIAKLVRRNNQDPRERKKPYSPNTVNAWLAKMRVLTKQAVMDFNLERDAMLGVVDFPVDEYETYTEEEPNTLEGHEVPRWLKKWEEMYPQHYAFVLLGVITGLRPSTLRPLRRSGPNADIKWDKGILLVRRSHTIGDDVMHTTKNKEKSKLPLPPDVMATLRAHVDRLPLGPMQESDLLFPSDIGGFRSSSCLDKPFREVTAAAGIGKHITPRAMRRTFKDLCRRSQVKDVVSMAISGHLTEDMHEHYQTVAGDEVLEAITLIHGAATGHRPGAPPVLN